MSGQSQSVALGQILLGGVQYMVQPATIPILLSRSVSRTVQGSPPEGVVIGWGHLDK